MLIFVPKVRVEQVPEVSVDRGDGVPHMEYGQEHQSLRSGALHRHEDHAHVLLEAVGSHEAVRPRERHTHQVYLSTTYARFYAYDVLIGSTMFHC